jgi:hypothetical protein
MLTRKLSYFVSFSVMAGQRPRKGVVVISNRFRVLGHEKLCPVLNLVAIAHVEGVAFELERLFKIGKLLVAEAGSDELSWTF